MPADQPPGRLRTVGVEEELLLVDPETRAVSSRAREVLATSRERGGEEREGADLDQELFRHQLETRTEPSRDLADVLDQVAAARRLASGAAEAHGLAVVACGAPPIGGDDPQVSPDDRYHDMVDTYGDVTRSATTAGMHVHVAIDSDEEGVACLDRIAPWLPVLLALSANSPYAEGRDTSYASWRTQMWSRWPSAGQTEPFVSVDQYRSVRDQLIATGAARDAGMLYLDARLSTGQPTLEVRILDVVTDVVDVGVLAALVRGLVETAAAQWRDGAPLDPWRSELLRAATWRASRYGTAGDLVDPRAHTLRPARAVVSRLVDHVSQRLDVAGETDRVAAGVERLLAATGAARQRAAHERTGSIAGVVDDLLARTGVYPGGGVTP